MRQIKLMLGDNIESLKKLPENSIDSVVTDAPYGFLKKPVMNLSFYHLSNGYYKLKEMKN